MTKIDGHDVEAIVNINDELMMILLMILFVYIIIAMTMVMIIVIGIINPWHVAITAVIAPTIIYGLHYRMLYSLNRGSD